LRRYIESLPRWVELTVVITVAFGPLVLASLAEVFLPHAPGKLSDAQLVSILVYEIPVSTVLIAFLYLRGWTLAALGLRGSPFDLPVGVALALAGYLSFLTAYGLVTSVWPQAAAAMQSSSFGSQELSMPLVLAISVINPIFEETFVSAYVIGALKDRPDPWTGIHVSVAIRLLYHLYEGAVAAVAIVPIGLLCAIWYARTGRLWPLIVAHAIWDFVPLATHAHW
jgi:membrane protease YdiL (CAAX protease family)